MKRKQTTLIAFLFLLSSILLNSCNSKCTEDGSLDEVKKFVPEDKYFKSSLKSLHFVMETSPIDEVDKMFSHLINTYKLPVKPDSLPNGTYIGETPYDAFDYKHVVEITIKNGQIVSINYNEIHKDGTDKKLDKKYNKEMSVTGTSPSIAYPNMEKELIEKQNLLDVDATSGATYSLYRFRYAVTLALMKAKLENSN